MKALKLIAVTAISGFAFVASSAFAEAPPLPSNINPDDHAAAASYYEGLVKEETQIVQKYERELEEYEDHAYAYGRQGQEMSSHLRANIREHKQQLAEDLEQMELHKKMATMATMEQRSEVNKTKAEVKLDDSVIQ